MSIRDIQRQATTSGLVVREFERWRLGYERANLRKADGYWHPSSISGCPTAAVYEYFGFPIPGAPHDARLLRIFDMGHVVHGMLQTQFTKAGMLAKVAWPEEVKDEKTKTILIPKGTVRPASEVPIVDEPRRLKGTLDVVFEIKDLRFVGELKTKHSSSFAKMQDAQEEHKFQAMCYHWKASDYGWVNADHAVVLYYSKDDSHMREFKIPATESRIKAVTDKLDLLNSMKIAFSTLGTIPAPYYSEPQKPPCRTCKWAQACHATLSREAWINKIKERSNEPSQQTEDRPEAAAPTKATRKPPVRVR